MLPVFDRHLDQVGEMVDQCREARDTTNVCLDRLVNRPFVYIKWWPKNKPRGCHPVWVMTTRGDHNWRSSGSCGSSTSWLGYGASAPASRHHTILARTIHAIHHFSNFIHTRRRDSAFSFSRSCTPLTYDFDRVLAQSLLSSTCKSSSQSASAENPWVPISKHSPTISHPPPLDDCASTSHDHNLVSTFIDPPTI